MNDNRMLREETQIIPLKSSRACWDHDHKRRAFLTVILGNGTDFGCHTVVDGTVRIGRSHECELRLTDRGVSWHHAKVTEAATDSYRIRDLESTNGLRINGVMISGPHRLRDGEKIVLGNTVIRFSLSDKMDIDFHCELTNLVGTDPLTGLESKRKFDDALTHAMEQACRLRAPLSLLMMDMDGLKQINDTHGHLFGAHAISQTGRIIARILGKGGHACRFGGDEFTVFLPGYSEKSAVKIAEKIRHAVENAGMQKDAIRLNPTISIGVAAFPEKGNDVLTLISSSDAALYRAKSKGKNRVER